MRVVVLTPSLNLEYGGGSNYSLHLTASELTRLGHQVELVVWNPAEAPLPAGLPYGLRQVRRGAGPRWATAQELRHLLTALEAEADLFHLYNPSFAFGGGLYRAQGGRRPVVATLNNYQVFCTNVEMIQSDCHRACNVFKRVAHAALSPGRKLISLPTRIWEVHSGYSLLQQVDRILPDSTLLQCFYQDAGLDLPRCSVIPEVIDYRSFAKHRPTAEQRLAAYAQGGREILFVGRLIEAKGADLLVSSLTQLDPSVRLQVAGSGPALPALRAQVAALGLQERVTFHGWIANDEIWRLYRRAQLFVHPGRWPEPFGRTVVEALALGLPAVVSDTGHPPVLVGAEGLLFEPGNVAQLADRIRTALERYPERVALAARAAARAAEFDYPRVTPRLVQVYERVLADSSQRLDSRTAAPRREASGGVEQPFGAGFGSGRSHP
jgi:glycosyltransferase involved in cell wall biosynthesis